MFELPNKTIFFTIERAIKEYRQFAQKQISEKFDDITVDQAMILILIANHPDMSQEDLGKSTFKGKASVTRMIDLLIDHGYLERKTHETDRRRFRLDPSKKGKSALDQLIEIIKANRKIALQGIEPSDIIFVKYILSKLISNCHHDT
ncbi:MAG: hypothetical protein Tsb004_15680 [Allomuricauda sp.]